MVGIYKITNKINGKIYVGQSIDIKERWYQHKYKAKHDTEKGYNSAIHQAFRKYGEENFLFEVIEECSSECLDERERFWIKELESLTPNGYNILSGGQKIRSKERRCLECDALISKGAKLCKKCSNKKQQDNSAFPQSINGFSEKEKLYYAKQILELGFEGFARLYGRKGNAAKKWCKKYEIPHLKGELREWYNTKTGIRTEQKRPHKISVYQIDIETNEIINQFESAKAAGLAMGASKGSHITEVCKGKIKTAYGYKWKYATSGGA